MNLHREKFITAEYHGGIHYHLSDSVVKGVLTVLYPTDFGFVDINKDFVSYILKDKIGDVVVSPRCLIDFMSFLNKKSKIILSEKTKMIDKQISFAKKYFPNVKLHVYEQKNFIVFPDVQFDIVKLGTEDNSQKFYVLP